MKSQAASNAQRVGSTDVDRSPSRRASIVGVLGASSTIDSKATGLSRQRCQCDREPAPRVAASTPATTGPAVASA